MRTPLLARIYLFFCWLFASKKPSGGRVELVFVETKTTNTEQQGVDYEVDDVPSLGEAAAAYLLHESPQRSSLAELLERSHKQAQAIDMLSPMDDPNAWLSSPAYEAPSSVDIARCQAEIDRIYGTTKERGGERSIMKLVWNGDRKFWPELYMSWDALGRPNKPATKRPRVRFKTLRDAHGRIERDVFPPRWLILTRLEREQFPNYAAESWVMDAGMRVFKQIRPDEPPPVYWLWWTTIAEHTVHCCGTADENNMKCFGRYASPEYIYEQLRQQKAADEEQGLHNPFEQIDEAMIRGIENDTNGYAMEIKKLKIESEISIENPWAMIGPKAAMKLGINTTEKARKLVTDYYDKKFQDASSDKVLRQRKEQQENGIII